MENIEDILFKSRELFFHFVDECNNRYRSGDDLEYYRTIIQTHRKINNIENILEDQSILTKIRETLVKWNMDNQGADLQSIDVISKNILAHKRILKDLYEYKLHKINSLTSGDGLEVLKKVKFVFKNLNVMKTKRQIVGVSKTLHFLLPDLILPIDGKYSMNFFYGYNKYSDNINAEYETLNDILIRSHQIVKNLNLSESDVDDEKWKTSIPKLIDNAIIGFSKEFEEFVDNDNDKGIINFLDSLSQYAKLNNYYLRDYLEERRDKLVNSERQKIKKKIIIIKAKEAGITVSDEEIDNFLKDKH